MSYILNLHRYDFNILHAIDLKDEVRELVWNIFADNMHDL